MFETCVVVCAMFAIGMINFPLVSFWAFIVYMFGRWSYGPMTQIPACKGGMVACWFCLFMALPWYTLFGNASGQILKPIRQMDGPDNTKMPQ